VSDRHIYVVTKPIHLYVSNDGVSDADGTLLGVDVERYIDIELSENDAKALRDLLNKKLNVEVYGSVSIRLKGRLIL